MKYQTIVADPPWTFDGPAMFMSRASKLKRDGTISKCAGDLAYPTMTDNEIAALPVLDLAESNAHLYLWTTNRSMVAAHRIAEAWGFKPKTILTWGKVHQAERSRVSMKTGYYFRGATEHVVFAVRGSMRINGTFPTLYLWPRVGEHSVKPEAFYDLVEQASPGPYVELFSRRHRMLWDVWGNESANTAQLGPVA